MGVFFVELHILLSILLLLAPYLRYGQIFFLVALLNLLLHLNISFDFLLLQLLHYLAVLVLCLSLPFYLILMYIPNFELLVLHSKAHLTLLQLFYRYLLTFHILYLLHHIYFVYFLQLIFFLLLLLLA